MSATDTLKIKRRSSRLDMGEDGRRAWRVVEDALVCSPRECAVILCDVWDRHWCRGAVERLDSMLPRMADMVRVARAKGILIIHAPSETMKYYENTKARKRAAGVPRTHVPRTSQHDEPPLPIDLSNGGCDTSDNFGAVGQRVWSRQSEKIPIDDDSDAITDDGEEVYSLLKKESRSHLFFAGVHTNICILNRSFGIKNMVRWGVDVTLIRDLTDAMYDPQDRPYVLHDIGTELVVSYIEKHWCPTTLSEEFLR